VRARIVLDGGAYASSSTAVCANAACFACGPYEVANASIDSYVVYTNNPPCGAMRGFGAVQVAFAHEAQMDKLAAALDMDPVDLRILNAMGPDSRMPPGQRVGEPAPVAELLERVRAMPMPPDERDGLPGGVANVTHGEGVRRGVGYGAGIKNIGFSEGFDDYSTARVRLSMEGGEPLVEVHTAAAEVGQGIVTVQAQIARTELGVERVAVLDADTRVGSAGSSSASRQTYVTGGAVQGRLRGGARAPGGAGGRARRDAGPGRRARGGRGDRGDRRVAPPPDPPARRRRPGRRARAVRVLGAPRGRRRRHRAGARARGRAGHRAGGRQGDEPAGARGPDRGRQRAGARARPARGDPDQDGKVLNASFTDYLLPTILDMPPMRIEVLEHADPQAPVRPEGRRRAAEHLHAARRSPRPARRDRARAAAHPGAPEHLVGLDEESSSSSGSRAASSRSPWGRARRPGRGARSRTVDAHVPAALVRRSSAPRPASVQLELIARTPSSAGRRGPPRAS
jgi:CO/xanthine dehydrogenase Mo-binding subunit